MLTLPSPSLFAFLLPSALPHASNSYGCTFALSRQVRFFSVLSVWDEQHQQQQQRLRCCCCCCWREWRDGVALAPRSRSSLSPFVEGTRKKRSRSRLVAAPIEIPSPSRRVECLAHFTFASMERRRRRRVASARRRNKTVISFSFLLLRPRVSSASGAAFFLPSSSSRPLPLLLSPLVSHSFPSSDGRLADTPPSDFGAEIVRKTRKRGRVERGLIGRKNRKKRRRL